MDFTVWVRHFERNVAEQRALEKQLDRPAGCVLDGRTRRAFVRSFQRFELGESGDGEHLLTKAARAGDARYTRALTLFVAEEQRHAGLFGRGLDHLGGASLPGHWSDAVFTVLRRAFGLRTELGLFLVAEAVAYGYFTALATGAPDPVLRAIGRRLEQDERDHLRFQVDRLALAYVDSPRALRAVVRAALLTTGLGAAVALAVDHRAALRACGQRPAGYPRRAVRRLRRHLEQVFTADPQPLGPLPSPDPALEPSAVAGQPLP
jgi:hypothetical protein